MLIAFAQYLCKEWIAGNARIRKLIKTTRIHLLPDMNPDGYFRAAAQVKFLFLTSGEHCYVKKPTHNTYNFLREIYLSTCFVKCCRKAGLSLQKY